MSISFVPDITRNPISEIYADSTLAANARGMFIYTSGPATNKFNNCTTVTSVSGTTIGILSPINSTITASSTLWFLIP